MALGKGWDISSEVQGYQYDAHVPRSDSVPDLRSKEKANSLATDHIQRIYSVSWRFPGARSGQRHWRAPHDTGHAEKRKTGSGTSNHYYLTDGEAVLGLK